MQLLRAVVLGGGVGGLTAAAALHRQGWTVTVLERAGALEPVGAGIALAPNAQRALDVIGLGDAVREMSAWQDAGGMRLPGGRWLSRTTSDAAARRFGGPVVVAHRAELVRLLVSRLPTGTVRTGATGALADPGDASRPARVTVTGEDGRTAEDAREGAKARTAQDGRHGEEARTGAGSGSGAPPGAQPETPCAARYEAELVVAADGLHSATRRTLFPDHPAPRYAGFTTWRLVVPRPETPFEPHETWGRGSLWGTVPLHDGRVYAYASAVTPPGGRAPDDERAELLRRFGDWHEPVPAILAAATPDGILRNDVYATAAPLPAYHHGRVALVGDAAHPMTPNLGQGGCQAIEDAVVLAGLAGAARTPGALAPVLADYTDARLSRTTDVVRRSARIGKLSSWTSAPACALRTAVFAAVNRLGPGLALRSLDGIADWSPPTAPEESAHRPVC